MPLSPLEIKIELLRRGDSIAALARKWGTWPEVVSRVIHRRAPFVYPDVRKKLAKYLGVAVADVGRERVPKPTESARAA